MSAQPIVKPRQGFTKFTQQDLALIKRAEVFSRLAPDHLYSGDPLGWRIRRWEKDKGDDVHRVIEPFLARAHTEYIRHPLTLDRFSINQTGDLQFEKDGLRPQFRGQYYFYAYAVFWACIFHENNSSLKHPSRLLKAITRQLAYIYDFKSVDKRWPLAWVAIYERCRGIRYDIRHQLPHYVENIVERRQVSQEYRNARIEIFAKAIDWLEQKVVSKLGLLGNQEK